MTPDPMPRTVEKEKELEPRELDALVAERVMGETTDIKELMIRSINDEPGSCGISASTFAACWTDPKWWGHTPSIQERARAKYIRPYSTSISDAWRVVDRMHELGFGLVLNSIHDPKRWRVRFYRLIEKEDGRYFDFAGWTCFPDSKRTYWGNDGMPEALCMAALKALDVSLTPVAVMEEV